MSASIQYVRLDQAVLCANCEVISNSEGRCQSCGSPSLMPLADKLGGVIEAPSTRLVAEVLPPADLAELDHYITPLETSEPPRHVAREILQRWNERRTLDAAELERIANAD